MRETVNLRLPKGRSQALYATYRQEALRLAEERKLILDQLHQNYQKFEVGPRVGCVMPILHQ